uniref:Ovule protein n=1 Tax=Meloidogyne incognita TaxID=6306 RepID=A0A914L7L0_MELIC
MYLMTKTSITSTNCSNCTQKTIGLEQQFLNKIFIRYKEIQTVNRRKWSQERLVLQTANNCYVNCVLQSLMHSPKFSLLFALVE